MQASQTAPREKVVFVCDDDSDIAEVTRLILERSIRSVRTFSVCEGIVEEAEKHQPALILLDLWMPEMGGERVVRLLKENPKTKHIPVYIFSAIRNVEEVVKRSGADGLISKPYEIEELEALAQKVLDI
jgi:CheY-like chemotaxis protein